MSPINAKASEVRNTFSQLISLEIAIVLLLLPVFMHRYFSIFSSPEALRLLSGKKESSTARGWQKEKVPLSE